MPELLERERAQIRTLYVSYLPSYFFSLNPSHGCQNHP
jgi:hypothetical protein